MNLMDLFVKVAYDDKDVDKGIEGTGKKGAGFAKTLGKAFKGVGAVVGAISTAAIALGGAFVKGAMDVSDYGSEVNDMSQKLNMSTQGFQEWRYILGQSGVDIGVLQGGMKKLSESAVAGSESFAALGISQEQLATLSTEELFNTTIAQLSEMEAGNERTALASDLFGRSATELLPILNQGADSIEEMRKQAEAYGLVMSDEAVKASDDFGDSVALMQQTLTGMKNRMMSEFLPSLTLVTDGLAKLFTGDMSGLDSINDGIGGFVGKIAEAIPQIIEIGGSIIQSLVSALMQNMPLLVTAAFDLISQFAGFVLENLPMLVETALSIITTLALGIAEQAPTLIPAIVQTMMTIINTLISNIPLLVGAAIQLVQGLADGVLDAIPLLVEMIPTLITSLIDAIITAVPMLVDAAVEIVLGLVDGIVAAIPLLVEMIPQLIQSFVDGIIAILPVLLEAAIEIVMGLVDGIVAAIPLLVEALPAIILAIVDFIIEAIPQIIDAGIQLLTSLVAALPDIITAIVEAIPLIIDGIVTAVLEGLPLIIQAGIDLLVALIQALPDIIVTIVEAIPQIISGLVDALTGNIDEIIMAGVELFVALIENLPTIIVEIVKAVPQIIEALVEAFADLVTEIWGIGENLVSGIWQGISDSFTWIKDKIEGWVGDVLEFIKKLFGINSPSKVMREEVGKMLSFGLGDGIMKYAGYAKNAMRGLMDGVMGETYDPTINASVNGSTGLYGDALASAGGMGGVTIANVNFNQPLQSTTQAAKLFARKLTGELYA